MNSNINNYIKRTPINGENIYDSHNYNLFKLYSDNLAFDRYILARNPMESGLIPNYYNQFQETEKEAIRFKHDYFRNVINKENYWKNYFNSDKIVEFFFNNNFKGYFNKKVIILLFLIGLFLFILFYWI